MDRKPFVGTWRLESFEGRGEDGEVSYLSGGKVAGLLAYDEKGNMIVQVVNQGRPRFASGAMRCGTPDEIKAAFEGNIAYFGTYDVDEEKRVVVHHVTGCSFPNWVGVDNTRSFCFSGDRLTLTTPDVDGQGTARLVWERIR